MKRLQTLVLLVTLGFSAAYAQEYQSPCSFKEPETQPTKFDEWFSEGWGMNGGIGANFFFGDVPSKFSDVTGMATIGLQKDLTSYLMVRLNTAYGTLKGTKDEYQSGDAANLAFKTKYSEVNATLKLNLFGFSENLSSKKVAPYIYAGVGLMNFRSRMTDSQNDAILAAFGYKGYKATSATHELEFPFGIGADFKASKALSFYVDARMTPVKSDKVDACVSNYNDKFLADMFATASVGFSYKFGYRDCDKDGVVNRKDKCPDTPYGVTVDANGCPLDSDGDGIPDYEDQCPNEAGLAEFNGCPDSDGDGIPDKDDKCPKEAGLAQFNGCPDTDGDGIPDPEDTCPEVAGLAQFNGCPDTDGDGIQDSEDACPEVAGLAKYNGCPDTDGDGIPDNEDACPEVAGQKANNGCPAVKKEVLRVFEKALTGIQFETGKDVIKKQSFPILDQVVKAMKENPEYNLEINGHTDNVGDPAKNQVLSEKRAASVRKYLTDKGVESSRMVSHGYGDTQPIADNKTAAGRTKNRRVEFKVNFSKIEIVEEK